MALVEIEWEGGKTVNLIGFDWFVRFIRFIRFIQFIRFIRFYYFNPHELFLKKTAKIKNGFKNNKNL